jgi:hypothetical protein
MIKTPKIALKLSIALIFLIIFCFAGYFYFKNIPVANENEIKSKAMPPLEAGKPIKSVVFADGSSFDMYAIANAELEMGKFTLPSSFKGLQSSQTDNMGTEGFPLDRETKKADGVIIGRKWTSGSSNLLLACNIFDPQKYRLVPKKYVWNKEVRFYPDNFYPRDAEPSWEAMESSAERNFYLPVIMIQLSDGAGGWITAGGPIFENERPSLPSVCVFYSWPRATKELEFRAIMPGQATVTWSLPNPLYPPLAKK